MASFSELEQRIADLESKLRKGNLPLDALPMKSLVERLNTIQNPEGDDFVLPASVGISSLAEVPHARVHSTVAQTIAIATHTALTHNTVAFRSEGNSIKVDLTNQPTRITATEAGVYLVTASVMMARTDVSFVKIAILINAAGAYAGANERQTIEGINPVGGVEGRAIATVVRLEVNDHVEAFVYYIAPAPSDTFIDFSGQRNQILTATRLSR